MNFIKSRKFLLLLRCWGGVVCREWVLSFVKWIACMDECSLVLFLGCFLGGNEVRWISLRKRVSQPWTTSICSCCVILFIYWWIVFTLILWRMFESVLGLLACRIFEVQSSSGFFLVLQGYISIKYFEKCFVVVLEKVYIHWHWLFLNSFFKILREREHRWARTSVEVGGEGQRGRERDIENLLCRLCFEQRVWPGTPSHNPEIRPEQKPRMDTPPTEPLRCPWLFFKLLAQFSIETFREWGSFLEFSKLWNKFA